MSTCNVNCLDWAVLAICSEVGSKSNTKQLLWIMKNTKNHKTQNVKQRHDRNLWIYKILLIWCGIFNWNIFHIPIYNFTIYFIIYRQNIMIRLNYYCSDWNANRTANDFLNCLAVYVGLSVLWNNDSICWRWVWTFSAIAHLHMLELMLVMNDIYII